jgi:polysaccharide pyruvyl transferase WcaK-like protein
LNKFGLNAKSLLDTEMLKEYFRADMIVDLSGDTLSDNHAFSLFNIFGIFIGKFLEKKIVVFSQSIGPFKKTTRSLARFCLNKVDLIVIRDDITKNYLLEIGVNVPSIYLAAEIAFLLKPASPSKVQEILSKEDVNPNEERSPLIGIGTSALISKTLNSKNNFYVLLMAKISDYLIEKLNAQVLFISHVIIPPNYDSIDDRSVAEKICLLIRNKSRIKMIKGDYSPEELKGIIGQCDLFIGARMHSNIASTSMHVPTVALSWSHKYRGIMRMLEQEEYVCDVRNTSLDELLSKITHSWSNRNEIRNKLASKTAELERSALYSCRLIKMLIRPVPAHAE